MVGRAPSEGTVLNPGRWACHAAKDAVVQANGLFLSRSSVARLRGQVRAELRGQRQRVPARATDRRSVVRVSVRARHFEFGWSMGTDMVPVACQFIGILPLVLSGRLCSTFVAMGIVDGEGGRDYAINGTAQERA